MSTTVPIKSCSTTTYAFSGKSCTIFAIIVNGTSACTTFTTLDARSGLPTVDGRVGVYQRPEYAHSRDLLYNASDAAVVDGVCTPYETR